MAGGTDLEQAYNHVFLLASQRSTHLAVDLEPSSHSFLVEGLESTVMGPSVVETRDVIFTGAFGSSHQRADAQHRDGGSDAAQPGHEHEWVGSAEEQLAGGGTRSRSRAERAAERRTPLSAAPTPSLLSAAVVALLHYYYYC